MRIFLLCALLAGCNPTYKEPEVRPLTQQSFTDIYLMGAEDAIGLVVEGLNMIRDKEAQTGIVLDRDKYEALLRELLKSHQGIRREPKIKELLGTE